MRKFVGRCASEAERDMERLGRNGSGTVECSGLAWGARSVADRFLLRSDSPSKEDVRGGALRMPICKEA
jgi:hypothetical protein